MNTLLRIHTDTAVRGEFVKAGEVIEVDSETAARLSIRGDVVTREQLAAEAESEAAKVKSAEPETNPDVNQAGDPTPTTRDPEVESRDPKPPKKPAKH